MATGREDPGDELLGRRWRLDDRLTRPVESTTPASRALEGRVSGRRVVLVMVAAVLTLWLGLDLAFRGWRARYQARSAFGASRVAPAIDLLARTIPPDVAPIVWRRAVTDTHAMLLALTGAGLLDEVQMEALRRDITARVAAARPETARSALAGLWDDLERKAGPAIAPDPNPPPAHSRHAARHPRPPRPGLLGPSPQVTAGWRK